MANVVQVFVSSTRVDLLRERTAAEKAIRALGLHFSGMEYFGARANRSLETCLEEVQTCDIFVLIIGSRYGTYVPGTRMSFTEREYREAESLSKPCLVFFKKSAKPEFVERDAVKLIALQRFKEQLRERWQIAEFGRASELSLSLATSLSREVRRLERSATSVARLWPSMPTISNELNAVIGGVVSRGVPREQLLTVATEEALHRLASEARRPLTVFVSHLESESDIVEPIARQLSETGFMVIANPIPSIHTFSWRSTISSILGSLDYFVPVISQRSIQNRLARDEREQAFLLSALLPNMFQVVLIRVDDTSVPAAYRGHRVLDLRVVDVDAMAAELVQIVTNGRRRQSGEPADRAQGWTLQEP